MATFTEILRGSQFITTIHAVNPHLEHCIQFWAPQCKTDVTLPEWVQWSPTKMNKGWEDLSWMQRMGERGDCSAWRREGLEKILSLCIDSCVVEYRWIPVSLCMVECVRETQAMDQAISGGPFQPQPSGDSRNDTHKAGRVPSPTAVVALPAGTSWKSECQ